MIARGVAFIKKIKGLKYVKNVFIHTYLKLIKIDKNNEAAPKVPDII